MHEISVRHRVVQDGRGKAVTNRKELIRDNVG